MPNQPASPISRVAAANEMETALSIWPQLAMAKNSVTATRISHIQTQDVRPETAISDTLLLRPDLARCANCPTHAWIQVPKKGDSPYPHQFACFLLPRNIMKSGGNFLAARFRLAPGWWKYDAMLPTSVLVGFHSSLEMFFHMFSFIGCWFMWIQLFISKVTVWTCFFSIVVACFHIVPPGSGKGQRSHAPKEPLNYFMFQFFGHSLYKPKWAMRKDLLFGFYRMLTPFPQCGKWPAQGNHITIEFKGRFWSGRWCPSLDGERIFFQPKQRPQSLLAIESSCCFMTGFPEWDMINLVTKRRWIQPSHETWSPWSGYIMLSMGTQCANLRKMLAGDLSARECSVCVCVFVRVFAQAPLFVAGAATSQKLQWIVWIEILDIP